MFDKLLLIGTWTGLIFRSGHRNVLVFEMIFMDYILLKYLFLHVQNYAKYQVCTWPKKATWALGLEPETLGETYILSFS